jgi:hypothetical protein
MVFPMKFEFFWLSSGLGRRFSLTLISHWRESSSFWNFKIFFSHSIKVSWSHIQVPGIYDFWFVKKIELYLNFIYIREKTPYKVFFFFFEKCNLCNAHFFLDNFLFSEIVMNQHIAMKHLFNISLPF